MNPTPRPQELINIFREKKDEIKGKLNDDPKEPACSLPKSNKFNNGTKTNGSSTKKSSQNDEWISMLKGELNERLTAPHKEPKMRKEHVKPPVKSPFRDEDNRLKQQHLKDSRLIEKHEQCSNRKKDLIQTPTPPAKLCVRCNQQVPIIERILISGFLLHRLCLTCSRCGVTLSSSEIRNGSPSSNENGSSKQQLNFMCTLCSKNKLNMSSYYARRTIIESDKKNPEGGTAQHLDVRHQVPENSPRVFPDKYQQTVTDFAVTDEYELKLKERMRWKEQFLMNNNNIDFGHLLKREVQVAKSDVTDSASCKIDGVGSSHASARNTPITCSTPTKINERMEYENTSMSFELFDDDELTKMLNLDAPVDHWEDQQEEDEKDESDEIEDEEGVLETTTTTTEDESGSWQKSDSTDADFDSDEFDHSEVTLSLLEKKHGGGNRKQQDPKRIIRVSRNEMTDIDTTGILDASSSGVTSGEGMSRSTEPSSKTITGGRAIRPSSFTSDLIQPRGTTNSSRSKQERITASMSSESDSDTLEKEAEVGDDENRAKIKGRRRLEMKRGEDCLAPEEKTPTSSGHLSEADLLSGNEMRKDEEVDSNNDPQSDLNAGDNNSEEADENNKSNTSLSSLSCCDDGNFGDVNLGSILREDDGSADENKENEKIEKTTGDRNYSSEITMMINRSSAVPSSSSDFKNAGTLSCRQKGTRAEFFAPSKLESEKKKRSPGDESAFKSSTTNPLTPCLSSSSSASTMMGRNRIAHSSTSVPAPPPINGRTIRDTSLNYPMQPSSSYSNARQPDLSAHSLNPFSSSYLLSMASGKGAPIIQSAAHSAKAEVTPIISKSTYLSSSSGTQKRLKEHYDGGHRDDEEHEPRTNDKHRTLSCESANGNSNNHCQNNQNVDQNAGSSFNGHKITSSFKVAQPKFTLFDLDQFKAVPKESHLFTNVNHPDKTRSGEEKALAPDSRRLITTRHEDHDSATSGAKSQNPQVADSQAKTTGQEQRAAMMILRGGNSCSQVNLMMTKDLTEGKAFSSPASRGRDGHEKSHDEHDATTYLQQERKCESTNDHELHHDHAFPANSQSDYSITTSCGKKYDPSSSYIFPRDLDNPHDPTCIQRVATDIDDNAGIPGETYSKIPVLSTRVPNTQPEGDDCTPSGSTAATSMYGSYGGSFTEKLLQRCRSSPTLCGQQPQHNPYRPHFNTGEHIRAVEGVGGKCESAVYRRVESLTSRSDEKQADDQDDGVAPLDYHLSKWSFLPKEKLAKVDTRRSSEKRLQNPSERGIFHPETTRRHEADSPPDSQSSAADSSSYSPQHLKQQPRNNSGAKTTIGSSNLNLSMESGTIIAPQAARQADKRLFRLELNPNLLKKDSEGKSDAPTAASKSKSSSLSGSHAYNISPSARMEKKGNADFSSASEDYQNSKGGENQSPKRSFNPRNMNPPQQVSSSAGKDDEFTLTLDEKVPGDGYHEDQGIMMEQHAFNSFYNNHLLSSSSPPSHVTSARVGSTKSTKMNNNNHNNGPFSGLQSSANPTTSMSGPTTKSNSCTTQKALSSRIHSSPTLESHPPLPKHPHQSTRTNAGSSPRERTGQDEHNLHSSNRVGNNRREHVPTSTPAGLSGVKSSPPSVSGSTPSSPSTSLKKVLQSFNAEMMKMNHMHSPTASKPPPSSLSSSNRLKSSSSPCQSSSPSGSPSSTILKTAPKATFDEILEDDLLTPPEALPTTHFNRQQQSSSQSSSLQSPDKIKKKTFAI